MKKSLRLLLLYVEEVYPKYRGIPWHLITVFILLSCGIIIAGYIYYNNQSDNFKKQISGELSAVADLKVNEIARWRKERLDDAQHISQNPLIASQVKQFIENPKNSILSVELLKMRMQELRTPEVQKLFESQIKRLKTEKGKQEI